MKQFCSIFFHFVAGTSTDYVAVDVADVADVAVDVVCLLSYWALF